MLLASPWKVPLLFICYFVIKDCGCTEEICIRALPPFYSELSISLRSNNYLPWYLALNDYLSFVWQTHSKICITGADRASEETSRDGREDTSWFTGGTLSLCLLWNLNVNLLFHFGYGIYTVLLSLQAPIQSAIFFTPRRQHHLTTNC